SLRKVPALLCGRRQRQTNCAWRIESGPLVVKKEESLVLNNRTTKRAAVVVPTIVWFFLAGTISKKVVSVEVGPATKIKAAPMKLVGARLSDDVDDRSPVATILS